MLEEIIKTARNDGLDEVEVVIPKDSGAGAVPQIYSLFEHWPKTVSLLEVLKFQDTWENLIGFFLLLQFQKRVP